MLFRSPSPAGQPWALSDDTAQRRARQAPPVSRPTSPQPCFPGSGSLLEARGNPASSAAANPTQPGTLQTRAARQAAGHTGPPVTGSCRHWAPPWQLLLWLRPHPALGAGPPGWPATLLREREGVPHSLLSTCSAGGPPAGGRWGLCRGGGSGESSSGDAREPRGPVASGHVPARRLGPLAVWGGGPWNALEELVGDVTEQCLPW